MWRKEETKKKCVYTKHKIFLIYTWCHMKDGFVIVYPKHLQYCFIKSFTNWEDLLNVDYRVWRLMMLYNEIRPKVL